MKFPHFIKNFPGEELDREWFGKRLKKEREDRKLELPAIAAEVNKTHQASGKDIEKVSVEKLVEIEGGKLHLPAGSLYDIVEFGYGLKMRAILGELFGVVEARLDPSSKRRYETDSWYQFLPKDTDEELRTPVLIGGDKKRFIWAIPLQRLSDQPMVTELLELNRHAEGVTGGRFPGHTHRGAELIYVVYGTVMVHIERTVKLESGELARFDPKPILKAHSFIHFKSGQKHFIENDNTMTPAFLHVTRVLD